MGSRARTFLANWRDEVRDSDLDATAKAVGLALSTRMNRHGMCFPSKERIATDTGLSARTVDGAIDRLEQRGLLDVSRSRGRSSNRYTAVSTPRELPGSEAPTPQELPGNPATAAPQPRSKEQPTPQELPPKAIESIPSLLPNDGREGGSSNGETPKAPEHIGQHVLDAYLERLKKLTR
jgi:DNA-binding transcriptional MocR family regulator